MAAVSAVDRPRRWDEPFSRSMGDDGVSAVLRCPPFSELDPERFPGRLSLTDILRNDARLVRYAPGDIVVRQGDYGNSAFFILAGAARVSLGAAERGIPELWLGRQRRRRRGWLETLGEVLSAPQIPEFRDPARAGPGPAEVRTRRSENDELRMYLSDVQAVIARYDTVQLTEGDSFGEIAALSRTPRTATVFAETELELVEVRWQGLRDIRSRSPEVKEYLDRRYRERSLRAHLRESVLFSHLGEDELQRVADQTEFETYGSFNWHAAYKSLAGQSAAERIRQEPVIVEEGDYANGLLLLRSGFARVSERYGHGHRTLRYLGQGQMFGLDELYQNWKGSRQAPFRRSLRAVGYADVLLVPTSILESYVFPSLELDALPSPLRAELTGAAAGVEDERSPPEADAADPSLAGLLQRAAGRVRRGGLDDDFVEELVESRFMNGTATMMINLDRCTRCDDCVRACAAAHEGNPRFIRHGHEVGHFMIANACMHCADPVCMIGCPTGAIHRDSGGGQVVINDDQCIGCSACANSCPYENIRMVEIRDRKGAFVIDRLTGGPILKATKCDLCVGQIVSPACENACPHGALRRVNMSDLDTVLDWVSQ